METPSVTVDNFLMKFAGCNFEITKRTDDIPGYEEQKAIFLNLINNLDIKIKLKIEDSQVAMETMTKEHYFNEGFKTAIKFMMNCANG